MSKRISEIIDEILFWFCILFQLGVISLLVFIIIGLIIGFIKVGK